MILEAITVEGFRCFAAPFTLDGFSSGINILAGPNGAGKSTLLRALRHALFDSHTTAGTGAEEAMRPWGTQLSPTIQVNFQHGSEAWRVEKRFLQAGYARLSRREAGAWSPISDGRAAEAAIREMLQAEAPARGLAADAHLGWLQVLWTPQGSGACGPWNESVRNAVHAALGSFATPPAAQRVLDLLESRYDLYYSKKTGKEKGGAGALLGPLRNEVHSLRSGYGRLRDEWVSVDVLRGRLQSLRDTLNPLAAEIERLTAEREGLVARSATCTQLRLAIQEAVNAETQARAVWQSANTAIEAWKKDLALSQELTAADASLDRQIESLRRRLHASALAAAEDTLRALEPLQQRWQQITTELSPIRVPEPVELARLESAAQQLLVDEARLAASTIHLRITAETALEITTATGSRTLQPEESFLLSDPAAAELRIPGIARISAATADRKITELKISARREREALATALASWESPSVADLKLRSVRKATLKAERDELTTRIRLLLGNRKRAEVEAEIARQRAALDALPSSGEPVALIDPRTAEIEIARAEQQRISSAARLQEVRPRLAAHAAGPPLAVREQELQQAALVWDASKARVASLQAELQALGADPVKALEELEAKLRARQAELARSSQDTAYLEGELKSFISRDLYSQLTTAEETLAVAEQELQRREQRAAAIKLLQETLADAERHTASVISGRVEEIANEYWRYIAGPDANPLSIGVGLQPSALSVAGGVANLTELSGGEYEQAQFAARLALALQVAAVDRQLAVFDDAFLATDPQRSTRILQLLREASSRLQILILTCHPERYAALSSEAAMHHLVETQRLAPA